MTNTETDTEINIATGTAHLTIPLLNELESLTALRESLALQTYKNIHLWMIVNQPESWWENSEQRPKCEANQKTVKLLEAWDLPFQVTVMDCSAPGKGWAEGKGGVGWARKMVMDAASEAASEGDILFAMDADTYYPPTYVESVMANFEEHPEAVGAALPYQHPLTNDPALDSAILRYEIYLRHYLLELFRSQTFFAFTALGSAMACPVQAYQAVGGLTPKPGGEDFYFLQKLRKYGPLLLWNEVEVTPGTRLSDRVGFGTGPALIKGVGGDWNSYPIYAPEVTDEIQRSIALFPKVYREDQETPISEFLKSQLKTDDLWSNLRKTAPTQGHFVRACHERFDGLRVLQYHHFRVKSEESDSDRLRRFSTQFMPELLPLIPRKNIESASVEILVQIRDILKEYETVFRQRYDSLL